MIKSEPVRTLLAEQNLLFPKHLHFIPSVVLQQIFQFIRIKDQNENYQSIILFFIDRFPNMSKRQNNHKIYPCKSQYVLNKYIFSSPAIELFELMFGFLSPPCKKPRHNKEPQVYGLEQQLKAKILKENFKRKSRNINQSSCVYLPALNRQHSQIRNKPSFTQYQKSKQFKQKKSFSLNHDAILQLRNAGEKQNVGESQKMIQILRQQKEKNLHKQQNDPLAKFKKFGRKDSLKLVSHRSKIQEPVIFYSYKGQKQTINQRSVHTINKGVIDMKKSVGCINTQPPQSPPHYNQIIADKNKSLFLIQQAYEIFSRQKSDNMQQKLDNQIRNKIQGVSPTKINYLQLRK